MSLKMLSLRMKEKLEIAEVGIKAIDDQTLEVELEDPLSYFLELTTFHAFFQSAKNGIKKAHQKSDVKELL